MSRSRSEHTPIHVLPIVEQWQCHGCGQCCRGADVTLSEADLARLRAQRWGDDPRYRGQPVVRRVSWLGGGYRLARRAEDNTCVFLDENRLCRIHARFGLEAKPLACRLFPLQLVPRERGAFLTIRRACPSAAAGLGPPLKQLLPAARAAVEEGGLLTRAVRPPMITPGRRRDWNDAETVLGALRQIIDGHRPLPLVRQLAVGLRFCDLLARARIDAVEGPRFAELVRLLADNAELELGDLFERRADPPYASKVLLRQTACDVLRRHPAAPAERGLLARWKLLAWNYRITRGRGMAPSFGEQFPEVAFDDLERPLGALPEPLYQPLWRYYRATAHSRFYALVARRGWSIVESFRALALSYAVALWILRYGAAGREPTPDDIHHIIGALERAQAGGEIGNRTLRRRVASLTSLNALPQLLAWYGR